MRLQDLEPYLVEGLWRPGAPHIGDDALHHGLDLRLALIVGALPLLVRCAETMPVGASGGGIVLYICALAVGKGR